MKNHWNKLVVAFLIASAFAGSAFSAGASEPVVKGKTTDKKRTVASEELSAVPTLEQELLSPAVPEKYSHQVAALMKREAESLYKLGYKIETMRKGEIVIAVIPTDELFFPNESTLMETYAAKLLEPFKPYFRQNDKFRVIVVCHTDDTGKTSYTKKLSEQRASAVADWFKSNAGATNKVVSFGFGAEKPLNPNSTRENRQRNRRIEIYIVPDQGTIELAKLKK